MTNNTFSDVIILTLPKRHAKILFFHEKLVNQEDLNKLSRFLKWDIFIQKALLISCLLSIVNPWLIILSLLLLGFWQIISGFYGAFVLKGNVHRIYLIGAFIYLGIMYLLTYGEFGDQFVPFVMVYIIGPLIIAIWYLNLTMKTLKNYQLKGFMIF